MQFLAAELIALILLVAVDDTLHERPPAATWATSLQVIGATAIAMAAVAVGQAAASVDLF